MSCAFLSFSVQIWCNWLRISLSAQSWQLRTEKTPVAFNVSQGTQTLDPQWHTLKSVLSDASKRKVFTAIQNAGLNYRSTSTWGCGKPMFSTKDDQPTQNGACLSDTCNFGNVFFAFQADWTNGIFLKKQEMEWLLIWTVVSIGEYRQQMIAQHLDLFLLAWLQQFQRSTFCRSFIHWKVVYRQNTSCY